MVEIQEVSRDFNRFWQLTTARNAFALNLIIATTLKRLSAVAFVIIGIVKVWIFGRRQVLVLRVRYTQTSVYMFLFISIWTYLFM